MFSRDGMKSGLVLALVLAGALGGCARDLTVDDWRREKVSQEISQIQEISGFYSGKAIRESTSEEVGTLEMTLTSDTRVAETRDRPGAEKQAVLSGDVALFVQGKPLLLHFDDGSYDSQDGSFDAAATIEDSLGKAIEVKFTGTVKEDQVSGSLDVSGQPESQIHYTLERGKASESLLNGSASSAGDSSKEGADAEQERVVRYLGDAQWYANGERNSVEVLVIRRSLTNDQEFLDLMNPIRTVDVSLKVNFGTSANPRITAVFFQNAQWDTRLGVLRGRLESGGAGAEKYLLSLNCKMNPSELSCDYLSSIQGSLFSVQAGVASAK